MELKNSTFETCEFIRIPTDIARSWKAAGAYLWENNGWHDLGNCYLYPASYPDMLERETQILGLIGEITLNMFLVMQLPALSFIWEI